MKRIILLIFTLFIGITSVKAEVKSFANNLTHDEQYYERECQAFFGDPDVEGTVAFYLQKILDVIKYAGIVLCIVKTVVDFAQALFSEEKDIYKSLAKKAFSRLFYAVLLFFLPSFVKVLLTFLDIYGTCGLK